MKLLLSVLRGHQRKTGCIQQCPSRSLEETGSPRNRRRIISQLLPLSILPQQSPVHIIFPRNPTPPLLSHFGSKPHVHIHLLQWGAGPATPSTQEGLSCPHLMSPSETADIFADTLCAPSSGAVCLAHVTLLTPWRLTRHLSTTLECGLQVLLSNPFWSPCIYSPGKSYLWSWLPLLANWSWL